MYVGMLSLEMAQIVTREIWFRTITNEKKKKLKILDFFFIIPNLSHKYNNERSRKKNNMIFANKKKKQR